MPIHPDPIPPGTGCSYTGPDDDEQCDTAAAMHVVALTGTTDGGTPTVLGMRTCLDHVHLAIKSAVAAHGGQWWVHRFHEPCGGGDSIRYFVDSYCRAIFTPDVRCDGCGHWMAEHGTSGCAADDEPAMGGCHCLRRGTS